MRSPERLATELFLVNRAEVYQDQSPTPQRLLACSPRLLRPYFYPSTIECYEYFSCIIEYETIIGLRVINTLGNGRNKDRRSHTPYGAQNTHVWSKNQKNEG